MEHPVVAVERWTGHNHTVLGYAVAKCRCCYCGRIPRGPSPVVVGLDVAAEAVEAATVAAVPASAKAIAGPS